MTPCSCLLEGYHKYECKYGDLILGLGSSALVRLAYRIVGTQSLKFFNNIKHHLNVDEKKVEIDNLALNYNIQGTDDYRAEFNSKKVGLVTNLNSSDQLKVYFCPCNIFNVRSFKGYLPLLLKPV